MLNEDTLIHILNSIVRIHKYNDNDNDNEMNVNIYGNYASKLTNRYDNYNYSLFKNSNNVYKNLLLKLQNYEKNKSGKTMIHGDPVFTNILINKYGKIKFIDMRGKIGNKLTIYGDHLYDWAKIYQSLIGYDEILLSKNIRNKYKDNMIKIFKKYFIEAYSEEDFENVKLITQSLIFTLIPLHNNSKCTQYYNLLLSKYLH